VFTPPLSLAFLALTAAFIGFAVGALTGLSAFPLLKLKIQFRNAIVDGILGSHAEEGKSDDLYVFQEGVFLSAVRLSDQRFVTLTEDGYTIKDSFASLNKWYVRTLRAEYGDRYGLPPMVS
jgi:hypothetical protein